MVPVDSIPVRKKARKEYERVVKQLEEARQEREQFYQHDRPRYERWLNATFGSLLTRMRELMRQEHESASLVQEVQQEFYFGNHRSIVAAYRAVLDRRNTPAPAPGDGQESDPGQKGKKSKSKKRSPDPFDEGFEDFLRDFAEEQSRRQQEKEMRDFEAGFKAPPPDLRLKDLYRTLVRKLHPDKNAIVDARKLEWWHQVQEAYEKEDVQQLEVILTLCEIEEKGVSTSTPVGLLVRITAQFKGALSAIKRELKNFKKDPAWNFSRLENLVPLENDVRHSLQAECARLESSASLYRQMIANWEALSKRVRSGRAHSYAGYSDEELF